LDEERPDDAPPVEPRARDYLSAAVESRLRGRAAIAQGGEPGASPNPFKIPLSPKGSPLAAMEQAADEPPVALRPTRAPVQPMSKEDLLPRPRISAEQEAILSRLSPPSLAPEAPVPARSPAPTPAPEAPAPAITRRTRAVEMPEPGERHLGRREFFSPEWDRYYNPGIYPSAKVPRLAISRGGPDPNAPPWTMVGRPRGEGSVVDSRQPYRASLKDGAVKDGRPDREVRKFLAQRGGIGEELDLVGPSEVPPDDDVSPSDAREAARRAEFESAMAELERSFREAAPSPPPAAPAEGHTTPRERAAPRAPEPPAAPVRPIRRAGPAPDAAAAPAQVVPNPRTASSPPPAHPIARGGSDRRSEEDEAEAESEDQEEGTLGKAPPPDHKAEAVAKRSLAHDPTGASLCPTCARRISSQNPILVCTACGRVACASCGKFNAAGQPATSIYQYEYKFNFPLCEPCFERHYNIQKNLARAKAYLSSGNITYAFYHAQTARQMEPAGPYAEAAGLMLRQVEERKSQNAKADEEWDRARRKIMRERTSVLR
jgi:hypothetical protein